MAKVPDQYKFLDISDYGRPMARWIVRRLVHTSFTPIDVTTAFVICGISGIVCLLYGYHLIAAVLFIFKSILDAADGELARVKNTPSYTGRYYDSVADIFINFLIVATLYYTTDASIVLAVAAFIGIQLQGTLYNYYYVILRNRVDGDTTSRIFEYETPTALPGETQQTVNLLHSMYSFLYRGFDTAIYYLDKEAFKARGFPSWFMTLVSTMGLGSQLLLISIFLIAGLPSMILPVLAYYTLMIFVFVIIRRLL